MTNEDPEERILRLLWENRDEVISKTARMLNILIKAMIAQDRCNQVLIPAKSVKELIEMATK